MNEEGENKCQLRFYVTSTESIWKSEYAQSVDCRECIKQYYFDTKVTTIPDYDFFTNWRNREYTKRA